MIDSVMDEKIASRDITRDDYKLLSSNWATGVAIVTTVDASGRPFGLTLSAATSLSIDPMQFLVCVDERSNTLPALLESRVFGINMLSQRQKSVSNLFASKAADKFDGLNFTLVRNVPQIAGVIGFARCQVAHVLQGGDHKIIVGDVTDIHVGGGDPLVYFRGGYRHLPLEN